MKNIKYIIIFGSILSIVSLFLVFQNIQFDTRHNTAFSWWPFYSSENDIISYSVRRPVFVDGDIVGDNKEIIIVDIPSNVYPPDIVTVIKVSPGAEIKFVSGSIDTSKVNRYLVTAENGDQKEYKVVFLGKPAVDLPIEISDCQDLQDIKYNLSANYYITNDIDCSSTKDWNNGYGFEPINYFNGIFDGGGYKISNLYINRGNTTYYVGLFGSILNESKIINLRLENVYVKTGPLVGMGSGATGGLVGYSSGEIENVFVDGFVSSKWTAGGLVGLNQGVVKNSYTDIDVEWRGYYTWKDYYPNIGGLVGYNIGEIRDSYSSGKVESLLYNFTRDYNRLGGLVGENGNNGFVYNSYSISRISSRTSDSIIGGLVGYSMSTSSSNSFWDIDVSGVSKSAGGASGRKTSQMKDISLYSNWDMKKVWGLDASVNSGYPYLRQD